MLLHVFTLMAAAQVATGLTFTEQDRSEAIKSALAVLQHQGVDTKRFADQTTAERLDQRIVLVRTGQHSVFLRYGTNRLEAFTRLDLLEEKDSNKGGKELTYDDVKWKRIAAAELQDLWPDIRANEWVVSRNRRATNLIPMARNTGADTVRIQSWAYDRSDKLHAVYFVYDSKTGALIETMCGPKNRRT
jgi:hypothetical protein